MKSVKEVRQAPDGRPLLVSGAGRVWKGVAVDEFGSSRIHTMTLEPRDHHILNINLTSTPLIRQRRAGRAFESAGSVGEASLMPAGIETWWDGDVPAHISFRYSPAAFSEIGDQLRRGGASIDVSSEFRLRDPFIASISTLFSLELGRAAHPAQEIVLESLATALMVHLLRCRSDHTAAPHADAAPAALQRAIDLVGDQPFARLSLDDLAGAAGLSRFHFSRLFRRHMGVSPSNYVERSRLDTAKAMIRQGQLSLADIAHAVGFADQSHFTRRFGHHEGCTPTDYARDHARRRASV